MRGLLISWGRQKYWRGGGVIFLLISFLLIPSLNSPFLTTINGNKFSQTLMTFCYTTISEEIAHPTVYHHLSQLSVDIQLNRLIKCWEDSGIQMKLTQVIFRSLSWLSPESADFKRQWTPVISNWINSWFHWPRTNYKLQFSQLPNQHGTTWAVTSTAQWADCFWECSSNLDSYPNKNAVLTCTVRTHFHIKMPN